MKQGFCWSVVAALAAMCWSASSHASGDFICEPGWKLSHTARSSCDNMALLAPGNDTRVNLLLLLIDAHDMPAPAASRAIDPLFDWLTLRDAYFPSAAP
ncbi:MAG: hypothetical protein ABW048_01465, partial [Sphingobium sp.]